MIRLRGSAVWRIALLVLLLALAVSLGACTAKEGASDAVGVTEEPTVTKTKLVLASTTSTQDSGLFEALIPAFEKAYPQYTVEVLAKGTGEALKLGENKDADVLLVHAKAREEDFVKNGFGTKRTDVMYNDFIIVGPAADPAGIRGMDSAADALLKIKAAGATFISRGDDSGTHTKEMSIWKAAGESTPTATWYQSAGKGMGDVLTMASEQGAYTLTDRATYLSMKENLELEILLEGDTALFNQYGVIPVVGAANPEGAQAFADWITGPEGQTVIASYGVDEYGQALFVPNAP